jgi:glutamate/tyrosine decarboxylase-like PLP-dependent enzyme
VLLYRSKDLRKHQYFTYPDWPGGLYLSPGLAGSRSGGIIASTWAAILATGESGYLEHADAIMRTATEIAAGVRGIPQLEVIGDPTFLVAFKAADGDDPIDIYLVNDSLKEQGWRMNALQMPAALHFCVTRPNTQGGTAEAFVAALRIAVAYAEEHSGQPAASGAMYGFGAGTPQGNETASMVMTGVLDAMHEVAPDPAPAA